MSDIIRKNCLNVCLLLCFSGTLPVYAHSFEKQAVLAVLTLNLARFTTWPESVFDRENPILNLCVVGDNIVQLSFAIINNKRINNKTLHVINLSRLRHLSQCHLIYLSHLEHKRLRQVILELKYMPILTIGENSRFIKEGGMVALDKIQGKIQLNINLPIIKQSGLIISSRILKLATIHHFSYSVHK